MLLSLAKLIVILFGVFLIAAGILMFFNPKKARAILRLAASNNWINYGEISIRMIPAAALVIVAEESTASLLFQVLGYFMILTSLVLFLIPRRWHFNYAQKCAEQLKPIYYRWISPFSIFFGTYLISCLV